MSDDTFGPSPQAKRALEALDMSVLCRDWKPSVTDREVVASMPLDKELTLSVSLRSSGIGTPLGVGDRDARVLILSAFVDEVVLFELRFWGGRLVLNAGAKPGQVGKLVLGADSFDFQVSFNPVQGGLAIVASWLTIEGRGTRQFVANVSNLKLPPARYYTLRLGAPKHFVDLSLLGWRVNATYDLAAPVCALPGICCAPTAEQAHSALAETSPLDILRLALQSIDSWRKVAEDALHALEGARG